MIDPSFVTQYEEVVTEIEKILYEMCKIRNRSLLAVSPDYRPELGGLTIKEGFIHCEVWTRIPVAALWDEGARTEFLSVVKKNQVAFEVREAEKEWKEAKIKGLITSVAPILEDWELAQPVIAMNDRHFFTIWHSERGRLIDHARFLDQIGFRISRDADGDIKLSIGKSPTGKYVYETKATIPKELWDLIATRAPETYEAVLVFDREAAQALEGGTEV